MSSTIATSSTRCGASPWRCSISSIATSCSRASLPPDLRPAARKAPGEISLPPDGRSAGARARARLRSRTRNPARRRSRGGPAARHRRVAHALRAGSRDPSRSGRPSHAADRLRGAAWCRYGRGGMTQGIDRARLTLMLNDLRLPAIKQDRPALAERADKESWPAARFLATLAEHEIAERDRRRLARHLAE